MVKNLPVTREMWVWILGWEDSPGEGNGNPLQFLAWRILIDRGAWQAIVHRVAKSRTWLSDFTFILSLSLGLPLMAVWKIRLSWWLRWCLCPDLIAGARKSPGKRNGYPLQYSRLENSMNRGAWWDTVYGVVESDKTKWLTFSFFQTFYVYYLFPFLEESYEEVLLINSQSEANSSQPHLFSFPFSIITLSPFPKKEVIRLSNNLTKPSFSLLSRQPDRQRSLVFWRCLSCHYF